MRAARALLSVVGGVAILAGLGDAATVAAQELTFLSTQLGPAEEAQRTRTEILKYSPVPANFVPEEPQQLVIHIEADMKSGAPTISLIGALHGGLAPLVRLGALSPLDEMAETLTQEGVPPEIARQAELALCVPGTGHVDSLNVAAAASVLLSEMWRRAHPPRTPPAPPGARKPAPPHRRRPRAGRRV